MVWKGQPKKVTVLYATSYRLPGRDTRVPRDTRNLVGICPDHGVRLNTTWRPIVNKYREGKVKSPPGGE